MKDARTILLNYLSGTPITLEGVRCTSDGIPVILGDLIQAVRAGSIPDLRLINTILFSTRSLNLGKNIDIEPITRSPERDLSIIHKHV